MVRVLRASMRPRVFPAEDLEGSAYDLERPWSLQ